ncbi:MAG: DUF748 domain-containing protein [Alphaproteobacteria bacterium]|nr:DUF748 domain-containing protein [Alphaproteobacteria bacterium]
MAATASVHRAKNASARRWGVFLASLLVVAAALTGARLYLNVWALDYVNRVLNRIEGYRGSVEALDIDLYRGAYRMHNLRLVKEHGNIPVPFIAIDMVDFSIQWGALLHGRIVSEAALAGPRVNFAVNRSGTSEQTGLGVDWTRPIQDLMPIDINVVTFTGGTLTYQDFSTEPRVNIYMHRMSGEIRNLRNVVDGAQPLPSQLVARGDSIGGGAMEIKGSMNILRPIPDMDLEARLEHVSLPELSNYTEAYAAIDIERGRLDVYSEIVVKNGQVSGYVKPLAREIAILGTKHETNPLKLAWEAVVATLVEIFSNQPRDQFATRIPLRGDLNNIETSTWPALGGIIRNAFFEAFRHGIDRDVQFNTGEN